MRTNFDKYHDAFPSHMIYRHCRIESEAPFVFPHDPEVDFDCQYNNRFANALFVDKPLIDDLSQQSSGQSTRSERLTTAIAGDAIISRVFDIFNETGSPADADTLNKLMYSAIRSGNVPMARFLLAKGAAIPTYAFEMTITRCVSESCLPMIQFLMNECNRPIDDNGLKHAIKSNNIHCVPLLLEQDQQLDANSLCAAVIEDSLEALKLVYESGKYYAAFHEAGSQLLFNAIKSLRKTRVSQNSDDFPECIARNIALIEWIRDVVCVELNIDSAPHGHLMITACRYDNAYLIQWLHDHDMMPKLTSIYSCCAIDNHALGVVKLLREYRCPFDVNSIWRAIDILENNTLPTHNPQKASNATKMELLKFLLTFIEPSAADFIRAMKSNRLSVYEAIMTHPKAFNVSVVDGAITLDCMRYVEALHKHDFVFTPKHLATAVNSYAFATCNYFIETLKMEPSRKQIFTFITYRQMRCLENAAKNGYQFGDAEIEHAVKVSSIVVLKWLEKMTEGCYFTSAVRAAAIRHGGWRTLLEYKDDILHAVYLKFAQMGFDGKIRLSELIEGEVGGIIQAPPTRHTHLYYYDLEPYVAENGNFTQGDFYLMRLERVKQLESPSFTTSAVLNLLPPPAVALISHKEISQQLWVEYKAKKGMLNRPFPDLTIVPATSQTSSQSSPPPTSASQSSLLPVVPPSSQTSSQTSPPPSTSVSQPSSHSMSTHIAVTSTSVSSVSIHVSQPSVESIPVPSASASASAPAESMPVPSAESMPSPSVSASGFSTEIIAEAAKSLVALSKAKSKSKSSVTLPKKKKRKRRPTITTTRIPVHDLIPRDDDDIGHDSDSDISIHSFQELA